MACIHNYGKATSRPATAHRAALRQYPSDMLCSVLDKTMGHLMEIWHLLVNPKYKELWSKSYTNELGHLTQGMLGVSKGTKCVTMQEERYTIEVLKRRIKR